MDRPLHPPSALPQAPSAARGRGARPISPHTPTRTRRAAALGTGLVMGLVMGLWSLAPASARVADPAPATAAPLRSVVVAAGGGDAARSAHDGTVEAVRQTVLAAQVPGAVVALDVRAGDRVKAGQVLLRLDARAAEQQAGAVAAQVQAARAAQVAASREFERQRQLQDKGFISPAALERAEAQYKATQAQAEAQQAAAGAARTETGFYVVRAPYAGIVSAVSVVLGDMAMPGRPLVTLHDPAALRVSAALPETLAAAMRAAAAAPRVELAGLAAGPGAMLAPTRWEVLPAVDAATHTVTLRLDLPPGTAAAPGQFARVWLPAAAAGGASSAAATRVRVPLQAVVRRAELTAVYVIGADGKPLLRQVRLGPVQGDAVEVLAGLRAGEQVALDPQAAAKVR